MNTNTDVPNINNLANKFNNLQIDTFGHKFKNNKTYSVDSLITSMNKIKIGKKKFVKNNIINKIYTKYDLYSLLNNKLCYVLFKMNIVHFEYSLTVLGLYQTQLIMDEIFTPVLVKYFTGPIKMIKMKEEEDNHDADCSIMEINE